MRKMTMEQLAEYLENNKTINSTERDIPEVLLKNPEAYVGMEYFCLTHHAEGYIAGYTDALGKAPDTLKCALIYNDDANYEGVAYPLEEVIVIRE
jgi:hypothetical protein